MEEKLCCKIYFSLTERNGNEADRKILFCYDPEDNENDVPVVIHCLLKDKRFEKSEKKDESFHPVWISIHSAQQLLKGQSSSEDKEDIFSQELLLGEKQIPIIHITMSDLFVDTLFGTDSLPMDVPRCYMIMDNSIWNYLVPLSDTYYIHNLIEYKNKENVLGKYLRKSQDCKTNFYEAVCSICKNYKKNLYRLKVAQEYADLSARLTKQSYLSGAHATGVSPFIFHSEMAAKQLIQREFRLREDTKEFPFDMKGDYESGSTLDRISNHRWRILLLDDRAVNYMDTEPFKSELDKSIGGWNCKKSIIYKLLESQLHLEGKVAFRPVENSKIKKDDVLNELVLRLPNKDTVVLIEYAQSIDEAKEALKAQKYDLILIDYLLNQEDGTHYGYELLEEIWDDQQEHKNDEEHLIYKSIKPHRHLRMYCMFISAYSSAVHDRLLAEGLNQSEKYWYINLGACPTNTPQLFLYNLIKLMDKRIEDAHIGRLSVDGIIEILEKIYDGAKSVRENAGDFYEKIQSYQYYYRNLLQDYDISVGEDNLFEAKGSVLVTHFLHKHINMGGLLEHLAQLVHLTAFGTVRQWPDMWEEYLYVKAQLDALVAKDNTELQNKKSQLCNKIEEFIGKLKSSRL